MLPEKISYEYDFPLNIKIAEITECPLHYHRDIELVVVLQGELKLKNGCCTYTLPEGSIFTNNGREVHGLYGTDVPNTVATIQLNNTHFIQYFPELSGSSYRTFALKEADVRFNKLREIVLGLLFLYLKKGLNYRQECTEEAIRLIEFMNKNFNLFSFDGDLVVSPRYDDLLLIERMSRIIPYIYEHHAERITLEDLASIEHLSTYYISHMIKAGTELSFREFLSFARVEFSEMLLLDTDHKIHAIARAVGFSTTAYYEKFFKRWFGLTPEEHRDKYTPMVKSPLRPNITKPVSIAAALSMVQQNLPSAKHPDLTAHVRHNRIYINLSSRSPSLTRLQPKLDVEVSPDDYTKLGEALFRLLKNVGCTDVILRLSPDDNPSAAAKLKDELEFRGFPVREKTDYQLDAAPAFGLDSIANMVYIFKTSLITPSVPTVKLMDHGDDDVILKGDSGLLTSSAIYKPAYYAYMLITGLSGELIASDRHYAAVRIGSSSPCYVIIAMNFNDTIINLCKGSAAKHEVSSALNSYNDELDININILNMSGKYAIKKYSFSKSNTIFDFMERLGFPEVYASPAEPDLNYYTMPETDVTTEEVDGSMHINFSIAGTGVKMTIIEPI